MDRRSKLLGMDVQRVDLNVGGTADIRHSLAGDQLASAGVVDYRDESLKLLELMKKAGVLEAEVVEKVLSEVEDAEEIVDAELLPSEDDALEGSDDE